MSTKFKTEFPADGSKVFQRDTMPAIDGVGQIHSSRHHFLQHHCPITFLEYRLYSLWKNSGETPVLELIGAQVKLPVHAEDPVLQS